MAIRTHLEIDRDELHRYMWENSDPRSHKFLKSQVVLAEELGISTPGICYIITEMREAGRLRKSKNKILVENPDVWKWKTNK